MSNEQLMERGMSKPRRIRTVLNGDQIIEATELELLHTPSMQRLYDLHQLGLTDRVFIDASHSRLHHVVGVLHQVENLVRAIVRNLRIDPDRKVRFYNTDCGATLSLTARELETHVESHRKAVRLMGFLHDLTHSPYGHTLEDEIQLLKSKHDEPNRQAKAFYRLLVQYVLWISRDTGTDQSVETGWDEATRENGQSVNARLAMYLDAPDLLAPPEDADSVELLAELACNQITQESSARHAERDASSAELKLFFRDLHFAMSGLLYLDCVHENSPKAEQIPSDRFEDYAFHRLITRILERAGSPLTIDDRFQVQRDAFFLDIIGNTICADLLDYAKRDAHFAGLNLAYDEQRIVDNFTLLSHSEKHQVFRSPFIRTAITLFSHKLRIDVPSELLNLLQVRFYIYERVLYHPTKCIAGAMLGSALQLAGFRNTAPEHFAFTGDTVFFHQLSEAVRIVRDLVRRVKGTTTLTEGACSTVLSPLKMVPISGTLSTAIQLLESRVGQEIKAILEDLRASAQLLDRLAARRYYKPVFRVLPGGGPQGINAGHFAEALRDPEKRFEAERRIERDASLPLGSVAIHCPNNKGPQKIAAMLIALDCDSEAHQLRNIAGVNPALFEKHQVAVNALEEMYRSMWRLVVAVAPRYRGDYVRINQVISRILYETVTDSANLPTLPERDIPNDEYMDRELKQAIRPAQVVFSTSMQDASVPSSQEQLPPDERSQEIPTIEVWLGGIGALYPPGKIRKQLTQSLPQWQELVAPLSPVGRAKFYGEFKESLVGESRGEAFTARDHEVGLLVQDAKQFVKTLLKDETNRKKETLFE